MSSSSSNFSTVQSLLLSKSSIDGLPFCRYVYQKFVFRNLIKSKMNRVKVKSCSIKGAPIVHQISDGDTRA